MSTAASSTTVRPATLSDLRALLYLEHVGFESDRFTPRRYRYLLTRANATTLLAEHRDRVVGAAVMAWRRGSVVGRLYNIVVDPSHQGGGLGSTLLAACEWHAAERGCQRIHLEVRQDNANAIAFYERRGYQVTGSRPDFYTDGSAALAMAKQLFSQERARR